METLRVGLGDRSYDIAIGADILQDIGPLCIGAGLRGRAAVVTNPLVASLYLEPVVASLSASGFDPLVIKVPDGEEHKGTAALNDIYSALIAGGMDRKSFIVALGGGVAGDMAGFAAATYLRGIDFVQVPTTLLAQVDSSVGGKTGINHPLGKNLIGAFHQPRLVVADVAVLRTLSVRDYLSGLAEVLKYGCVLDAGFFRFIEEHVPELAERETVVLQEVVRRSCSLKASVVEQDETEQGLRAVLNYGHTLGHAVEALGSYRDHRHGEAVAIGMVCAASFSRARGLCTDVDVERIRGLLVRLGLPTELPSHSQEAYAALLSRDKKVREKGLTFVCNRGIGDFELVTVGDLSALVGACLPEV